MFILKYLGGFFLGGALGANDCSNVFGTAVSSRMIKYSTAVILSAIFVFLGAVIDGKAGIETLSKGLRNKSSVQVQQSNIDPVRRSSVAVKTVVATSFAAAITVTIMTLLKMPISTSQAVVGAIVGVGLMQKNVNLGGLEKIVICWITTPLGGAFFTIVFYYFFKYFLDKWKPSVFIYDPLMSLLLTVCGCYGAYALGANNVANVSAVFVGAGMMTTMQAACFGGIAIATGVLFFAKPVMTTVGKSIIKLNAFTAFVCVLSHAVTIHIYAEIGVPVSSTQAIIGALFGIGFIKGAHVINYGSLLKVFSGWLFTPVIACALAMFLWIIENLSVNLNGY
ncbi:MAG: hypothetical protein A2020_14635 [Lentisphaerae bacterium GWF2_45_14]|nr:MAG: hypothetical protein A2020_14635 [Lentisphaerae bacterium GWF2_45_14]